jgi:hypothetical protein
MAVSSKETGKLIFLTVFVLKFMDCFLHANCLRVLQAHCFGEIDALMLSFPGTIEKTNTPPTLINPHGHCHYIKTPVYL